MKIAIVGSGETYIHAPFGDPTWKVWGFSRRNFNKLPAFDQWFELHHPRNYPRYEDVVPGYIAFLDKGYTVDYDHFPFRSLIEEFGPYFLSEGQAPWMMAYAIRQMTTPPYENSYTPTPPHTLGLWGIEGIEKHHAQRREIHYFTAVARYRGIEVTSPQNDLLTPPKFYAYEGDTAEKFMDRIGISEERKQELYANPPKMRLVSQ